MAGIVFFALALSGVVGELVENRRSDDDWELDEYEGHGEVGARGHRRVVFFR